MPTRVLVVEDEPAIAEAVVYALESEGHGVTHFGTGSEAVAVFEAGNAPDFVVLDVGLPDIGGFDVCRAIRKISDVPILFLTARESEIDRVVGLEIGADDYMVKPFSPRELTARVQAILRRTMGRKPVDDSTPVEVLRRGPFSLDPERYRAECSGTDLGLSRYEFGMLKAFLEHPGRVYTRDRLMELVWDEPDSALDRTVDAHVKTLRKKIHAVDPSLDPVVTHRGIGYSWDERV